MKNNHAFRITTAPTLALCAQLDCRLDADDLDDALADAGYARLDHGLSPGRNIAFLAMDHPPGRDPGHRAAALRLALALSHIVHADGPPSLPRLELAAERVLDAAHTDPVGEELVYAVMAYAAKRDPGSRMFDVSEPFNPPAEIQAKIAHEIARHAGVITDVAIERAILLGENIPGWKALFMANIRIEEPVVRVKRHDAEDFTRFGIEAPVAELIAWVKANPNVTVKEFEKYANAVGVDPWDAEDRIRKGLQIAREEMAKLPSHSSGYVTDDGGGPSSIMISSSSGLAGPAGSKSSPGSE